MSILFGQTGNDSDKKFIKKAVEIIDILVDAIGHADRFTKEETIKLNKFSDLELTGEPSKIQKSILDVYVKYLLNVRPEKIEKIDDEPLIKEYLRKLEEMRGELNSLS